MEHREYNFNFIYFFHKFLEILTDFIIFKNDSLLRIDLFPYKYDLTLINELIYQLI